MQKFYHKGTFNLVFFSRLATQIIYTRYSGLICSVESKERNVAQMVTFALVCAS